MATSMRLVSASASVSVSACCRVRGCARVSCLRCSCALHRVSGKSRMLWRVWDWMQGVTMTLTVFGTV